MSIASPGGISTMYNHMSCLSRRGFVLTGRALSLQDRYSRWSNVSLSLVAWCRICLSGEGCTGVRGLLQGWNRGYLRNSPGHSREPADVPSGEGIRYLSSCVALLCRPSPLAITLGYFSLLWIDYIDNDSRRKTSWRFSLPKQPSYLIDLISRERDKSGKP